MNPYRIRHHITVFCLSSFLSSILAAGCGLFDAFDSDPVPGDGDESDVSGADTADSQDQAGPGDPGGDTQIELPDIDGIECTPNLVTCVDDVLLVCSDQGEIDSLTPCDHGCSDARLACNECTPGLTECIGSDLSACQDDGSAAVLTPCPFGCDSVNLQCNGCTPSTTACYGDAIVTCDASGNPGAITPCPFGCDAAAGVPRCYELVPSNVGDPSMPDNPFCAGTGDLLVYERAEINTDTGEIAGAETTDRYFFQISGPDGNVINVFSFRTILIAEGAILLVLGTSALTLLACESATISGIVDLSAQGRTAGPGGFAGGVPTDYGQGCGPGAGGSDSTGDLGFSGAGGGGSGGSGGDGGSWMDESRGGSACGESFLAMTPLRGGSGGGGGAPNSNGGIGGGGGGAIQISCGGAIVIGPAGIIDAGGAGGGPGLQAGGELGSGGGGGSGGAVLLEGAAVTIQGRVAANGGGGGGGGCDSNDTPSQPGEDGRTDSMPAAGGNGGSMGGDGGAGYMPDGAAGNICTDANYSGGGGGGGAAGAVRINTPGAGALTFDPAAAIVSPDEATGLFTQGPVNVR